MAMNFRKLAIKRVLPDIFLALLAFIYLRLAVQESKIIENVPDLILFVNEFAKVVVDICIPKIDLLSRSNTRPISK